MESLTALLLDLRQSWRGLQRSPRFLASAIVLLGLALAVPLGVVGVLEALLWSRLSVEEPEQLFNVYETRGGDGFRSMSYLHYLEIRQASRSFQDLAAHYSTSPLHVDFGDAGLLINGAVVSQNYFRLLGVEPGLGRFFLPEEDAIPGTHPVVVISDRFWRHRLGGQEDVLGSTLILNQQSFSIIGVAPTGFDGLDGTRPCEVWIPTMMASVGNLWCDGLADPKCRTFEAVGRLAAGESRESARVEMDRLALRIRHREGSDDRFHGFQIAPLAGLGSETGQTQRQVVVLLTATMVLVLLVACANLSGWLIARGLNRRREVAVRLALGAPRWRLLSLFVGEALLLALAGGSLALLLATWAGPLGTLAFGLRTPLEIEVSPVLAVCGFGLCALVGFAVGGVSGFQVARPELVSDLRTSGGCSPGRRRLLAAVVGVQIAVAFVLLHSTGLLTRSLFGVLEAPAVDPAHVATFRLQPRFAGLSPERGEDAVRTLEGQLRRLPGVRAVGYAKLRPLRPGFSAPLARPGDSRESGAAARVAGLQPVAPGTFETLGHPILRGRDFDARDVPGAPEVIVVSRRMADSLWPGQDAVGRHLVLHEASYEVIGVVGDSPYREMIWGPSPQAFSSFWQDLSRPDARFTVRFEEEASGHLENLREMAYRVDPAVPVTELGTLEGQLRNDLSSPLAAGRLAGAAGLLAAVLSGTGLSGVLALLMAQRRRELGIRKALGAGRRQMLGLVAGQSARLTLTAVFCGVLASMALGPWLGRFLYGLSPGDPWSFAAALAVVFTATGWATWHPARRAARVDPMKSIRGG